MNADKDPLLERARRLGDDLPPDRDLWPGIEARIRDSKSPRSRVGRWLPLAAAAAVVMAVAAIATLGPGRGPVESEPVPALAFGQDDPAWFGPGHALGPQYQLARAGLVEDLDRRLAALPPDTRAIVEHNLRTIREAVAEINAALAEDPGNVFLQELLLTTYQDELAMLSNVRRATERLPKRTEI
jgi:hypothetical protein